MATFIYPLTPVTVSTGDLATEATLLDVVTAVESIDTKVATEATLAALDAKVTAVNTGAVVVSSSALPTGAATEAKQDALAVTLSAIDTATTNTETNTASIDTKTPNLGQTAAAGSVPVVLANDQTLPLPSGASTEATLSALNAKVTAVNTGAVVVSSSALPSGAATEATLASLAAEDFATQTELASLNAKVTAVNTGAVVVSSSALPSGAATEATLATIAAGVDKLNIVDQIDTTPLLDTSSTNIPASASNPVTAVASLAANVKKIVSVEDIGEFIGVYTGAAASEVLLCVLPLGGGEIEVEVASGTRISLRNMKNATISTGFIALNFLG